MTKPFVNCLLQTQGGLTRKAQGTKLGFVL
jgi:hypothetical protein